MAEAEAEPEFRIVSQPTVNSRRRAEEMDWSTVPGPFLCIAIFDFEMTENLGYERMCRTSRPILYCSGFDWNQGV